MFGLFKKSKSLDECFGEPKIKTKAQVMTENVVSVVKKALNPIILVVAAINIVALIFTSGLLFMAALSATAMCISFACLWIGSPDKVKNFILGHAKMLGWGFDCFVTISLMIIGFKLGATLGLMCLFLGLGVSFMCQILRFMGESYEKRKLIPVSSQVVFA